MGARDAFTKASSSFVARQHRAPGGCWRTPEGTLDRSGGTLEDAGPAGSPLPADKAEALERVRQFVQLRGEDQCWPLVWPEGVKGTDDRGRPRIKVSGRYVKIYQLVYEEANGEQGPGVSVDHACHNEDASPRLRPTFRNEWRQASAEPTARSDETISWGAKRPALSGEWSRGPFQALRRLDIARTLTQGWQTQ